MGMKHQLYPETSKLDKRDAGYFELGEEERAEIQQKMSNDSNRVKQVTNVLIPEDVREKIDAYTQSQANQTQIWYQDEPLKEPEVLFLGTSGMKPMARRNTSAIYVFSHKGAVLMDCSEGTYGQLVDYVGVNEKLD